VGQGKKVEMNRGRPNRRCTTKSKEARGEGRVGEVRCGDETPPATSGSEEKKKRLN
jgi:hypothetical protein